MGMGMGEMNVHAPCHTCAHARTVSEASGRAVGLRTAMASCAVLWSGVRWDRVGDGRRGLAAFLRGASVVAAHVSKCEPWGAHGGGSLLG